MRPKKCNPKIGGCGKTFTPDRSFQIGCSIPCAINIAKDKQEKKKRKDLARRKQDLLTFNELVQKAQYKAFNPYITARDVGLPCPSCGRPYDATYWSCGHYLSVGSTPELRFNELNAAGQCQSCNSGGELFKKNQRAIAKRYKETLIERIGPDKVEWLHGPHQAQNWTREEVREIEAYYKQKLKQLRAER